MCADVCADVFGYWSSDVLAEIWDYLKSDAPVGV